MINVSDLRNCPFCGSDEIGVIGDTHGSVLGKEYCIADIKCFSCNTAVMLNGKNENEVKAKWNGEFRNVK